MITGDGWEVHHRNPLQSTGPEWTPVAFFVPVAHPQGINIVVLVLIDGQLTPGVGKLRRTDSDRCRFTP